MLFEELVLCYPIPKCRRLDIPKICQPQAFRTNLNAFNNLRETMSNLDIENLIKVIDPDIEQEPSGKRLTERLLGEVVFQPENINTLNQQYITSITIENFKCIGDAVTIPIRPITLLFGKNSTGKSTVLQALDYYDLNWRNLSGEIEKQFFGSKMSGGRTIDFSNFPSIVHRHELDRRIRIRVEYANFLNARDTDETQNQIYQWRELVTGYTGYKYKKEHPVESVLLGISLNEEEMVHFSWKLEETSDETVTGSNGEKLIRLEKKEEGFPEEFPFEIYVNNTNHKAFVSYCLGMLKNWSHNQQEFVNGFGDFPIIRHLGPFREVPDDYETSPTPDESRWAKGYGAWEALVGNPELVKKTNRYMRDILKLGYTINDITLDIPKKPNITLDMNSEIIEHLKKICNSEDVKVDDLKKQVYDPIMQLSRQPVIQLHLHDENKDIEVGLSDIGVGIAQIIPVVVGVLDDSQSPGFFAVEQPELHVHPAVQVALGDVFIDSIKRSVYPTIEEFLDQSPAMQEALDKFLPLMENSKKELLDNIKNINEPAIEAFWDKIIAMIQDTDPLEVEVFLDRVIRIIKDNSLDVQFKYFFKIKETYNHNIQVATKEWSQVFSQVLTKYLEGLSDSIKNSNRTMLIETHSEHLLLRLLRRVRETNVQ